MVHFCFWFQNFLIQGFFSKFQNGCLRIFNSVFSVVLQFSSVVSLFFRETFYQLKYFVLNLTSFFVALYRWKLLVYIVYIQFIIGFEAVWSIVGMPSSLSLGKWSLFNGWLFWERLGEVGKDSVLIWVFYFFLSCSILNLFLLFLFLFTVYSSKGISLHFYHFLPEALPFWDSHLMSHEFLSSFPVDTALRHVNSRFCFVLFLQLRWTLAFWE